MYCVYKIQNIITNEVYIGMTSNIEKRWYAHKKSNSSNPLLQTSIKYWGIDNFCFEVLEDDIPNKSDAMRRENYFMEKYNSVKPYGFNYCMNGGRNFYSQDPISKSIRKDIRKLRCPIKKLSVMSTIEYKRMSRLLSSKEIYTENDLSLINNALGTCYKPIKIQYY